ncbi:MAG: O-antigen ligase family protein [Thermomonas sp.]
MIGLRVILAIIVVLMPNLAQVPWDTGIMGLNLANLCLLFAVIAIALTHDHGNRVASTGELTPAICAMFFVLMLSFAIAANAVPANVRQYAQAFKEAAFYPLFYIVFRRCRLDLAGTRQLIIVTMVVAAVAGVQAIRQGLDYGIGHYNETHRAAGPFGHDYKMANLAGAYYAMFLPMFLALALFLRNQKVWRIAAIAGVVILSIAIMVTFSRQSYLIALVCAGLLVSRRNVVLALVLTAAMWSMSGYLPDSVVQRVEETRQANGIGAPKLDVSTASRFEIWQGALQMWHDHPLGVGLDRFKEEIGNYSTTYEHYDAHNFYLLMLAECGPLGILAVAWLLWRLARLALRVKQAARDNPEANAIAIGFGICALAMAMTNLYGSRFFEGTVMAGFWILCGLVERYASLLSAVRSAPAVINEDVIPVGAAAMAARFPLAAKALPGRVIAPANRQLGADGRD